MKKLDKAVELDYYIKEGISPVHYNLSNLKRHFDIRNSLYYLLGLPSKFLKNTDILEVAPGSGHNSLFTSSLGPKTFDLVEPNPHGCKDIKKIFNKYKLYHTSPKLFQKKIEEYNSNKKYDLVITEGWPGGYLEYDRRMLRKISSFTKKGGLLFISFFPPSGALSTYVRRLISNRLLIYSIKNIEKTKLLSKTFSPHLKTMGNMTRTREHWIQDTLLNPYICLAHNTPQWCDQILGKEFIFYQSVPKFSNDWRWYKSLHGENKKFNKNFVEEYSKIIHNLIDFRIEGFTRDIKKNLKLEKLCCEFSKFTNKYERFGQKEYKKFLDPVFRKIIKNINEKQLQNTRKALEEARNLLLKDEIKIKDVQKMKKFKFLFGREQCYLSFIKK